MTIERHRPDGVDTGNASQDLTTVAPFEQEGARATDEPATIHIDADTQVGTGSGTADIRP